MATGLVEISHDPSCLDDGAFWAVSTTFEGGFTAAKFSELSDSVFPEYPWEGIESQWESEPERDQYIEYVESIREHIAQGWVYQVNACRQLSASDSNNDLRGLFSRILKQNPAPWASYLEIPGINIASASPELFLFRDGDRIKTSPIKGTQALGSRAFGNKDQSENIMIVDLVRHDLSQVCEMGSIHVPRLMEVEQHPGLVHLVSDVSGKLRPNISWGEIFAAISPAGSVSGAPKIAALEIIKELEPVDRGPYCGGIGWIMGDKCEMAVGIRTFWRDFKSNQIYFGTGAGITWGSDPLKEWNETVLKANRLISIAGGQM